MYKPANLRNRSTRLEQVIQYEKMFIQGSKKVLFGYSTSVV